MSQPAILVPSFGILLVGTFALASALPPLLAEAPAAPMAASAVIDTPSIADETGSALPRTHNYKRHPNGLFYVTAKVNGEPIRFLVDTGSSVVVLTASDAKRAGVDSSKGPTASVSTAGGKTAMRWARLDHVRLAGRSVHDVPAAIASGPVAVSLLGQNFLSKLDSFQIEGDRLSLR